MSEIYNRSVKDILEEKRIFRDFGLTSEEAKKRQRKYGKNTLSLATTPLWRKLIEPFLDLFMVILLVALVLSIIQGSTSEIVLISIDIIMDALIYYYQQFSTERILRNLRNTKSETVTVIRDGNEKEIDSTDLVPGDIMILKEGSRIFADGRILDETGLLTNESMLTGESDSVAKDARAISGIKKIYEQKNMVFSGSFVITGTAHVLVLATGNNTEYGHIASLASSTSTLSPIQEKINSLVVKIAAVILILAGVVMGIQLIEGMDFFSSAEYTLALIVSAVPEDLPIATAIILALGASRLSKKRALVRDLRAIESIGVVTTVASDKTGTLTENRLSVGDTWSPKKSSHIGDFLVRSALPATESGDPMDKCLWEYVEKERIAIPEKPVHSYLFDHETRMSGNLFEEKGKMVLYLKGAPESIIRYCNLTEKEKELARLKFDELSSFGYKVIALATVTPSHEINELERLSTKDKFTFQGFVAVSDTLRKEAKSAIRDACASGVQVKMLTGDHAGTAFAIGKKLGLAKHPDEVLDCSKLSTLDADVLASRIRTTTVFARVTPEDKYRILELMKQHEIVAMTGDGVNDVPALRSAHVGVAMGDGPSIVEDASDIVLMDNNFASIVTAIKEGRVILANIRRMLIYLLATNAGEVIVQLFGLLFGHTHILLPVQILWVNLVTDSIMIIPIGLEPAEDKILHDKPEDKSAPILEKDLVLRIVIISVTMAAVTSIVYFITHYFYGTGASTFVAETIAEVDPKNTLENTLAFTSLVVMQWGSALSVRGLYDSVRKRLKVKNPLFFLALTFAIILQLLATFTPLSSFVSVIPVPPILFLITIVISFFAPILTSDLHKKIVSKKSK